MYTLTYTRSFDAAHYLPWHEGKCQNLHGHTWEVQVDVTVDRLQANGIVVDFGDLKEIIDSFDHKYLNDIFRNPTAELIAKRIHEKVSLIVPTATICVTVWESEHSKVAYYD